MHIALVVEYHEAALFALRQMHPALFERAGERLAVVRAGPAFLDSLFQPTWIAPWRLACCHSASVKLVGSRFEESAIHPAFFQPCSR